MPVTHPPLPFAHCLPLVPPASPSLPFSFHPSLPPSSAFLLTVSQSGLSACSRCHFHLAHAVRAPPKQCVPCSPTSFHTPFPSFVMLRPSYHPSTQSFRSSALHPSFPSRPSYLSCITPSPYLRPSPDPHAHPPFIRSFALHSFLPSVQSSSHLLPLPPLLLCFLSSFALSSFLRFRPVLACPPISFLSLATLAFPHPPLSSYASLLPFLVRSCRFLLHVLALNVPTLLLLPPLHCCSYPLLRPSVRPSAYRPPLHVFFLPSPCFSLPLFLSSPRFLSFPASFYGTPSYFYSFPLALPFYSPLTSFLAKVATHAHHVCSKVKLYFYHTCIMLSSSTSLHCTLSVTIFAMRQPCLLLHPLCFPLFFSQCPSSSVPAIPSTLPSDLPPCIGLSSLHPVPNVAD